MNKKIEEFTIVELKALAYDILAQSENLQNNLKIVNSEIAKRSQAQVETGSGEEVKKEEEVKEEK